MCRLIGRKSSNVLLLWANQDRRILWTGCCTIHNTQGTSKDAARLSVLTGSNVTFLATTCEPKYQVCAHTKVVLRFHHSVSAHKPGSQVIDIKASGKRPGQIAFNPRSQPPRKACQPSAVVKLADRNGGIHQGRTAKGTNQESRAIGLGRNEDRTCEDTENVAPMPGARISRRPNIAGVGGCSPVRAHIDRRPGLSATQIERWLSRYVHREMAVTQGNVVVGAFGCGCTAAA